ncbi:redoxin family protein [Sphingomonas sp. AOB5]|uniref:redoxin family protein n=1 Tax=Sphingomonas sp. AOB5 TaxID=3034017 RepID=UPI0023F91EB7|nr:redoxin family protein [Sphingomonas sp. AOB5]MDF7774317.1 redoxin family protein [Sphingomonas sp. AOB5]
MRRVLIWAPLALFVLVFGLVASGIFAPGDRVVKSALIGQPAPAFTLPALLPGKPGFDSKAFADGKPRLVNIFASWCGPCIAEAPQLMKLKAMGIEIVGIATADTPEAMQAFLTRNGDPFSAVVDDRNRKVQFAFGSAGVPETFVIDGRGKVTFQHIGYVSEDDVPKLLEALAAAK